MLVLACLALGLFRLPAFVEVSQVLVIHRAHQRLEDSELCAFDAVTRREAVYGNEGDRALAPHGAVLAVILEAMPRFPEEEVLLFHLGIFREGGLIRRGRGVGLFIGKIGEELVRLCLP